MLGATEIVTGIEGLVKGVQMVVWGWTTECCVEVKYLEMLPAGGTDEVLAPAGARFSRGSRLRDFDVLSVEEVFDILFCAVFLKKDVIFVHLYLSLPFREALCSL